MVQGSGAAFVYWPPSSLADGRAAAGRQGRRPAVTRGVIRSNADHAERPDLATRVVPREFCMYKALVSQRGKALWETGAFLFEGQAYQ